MAIPAQGPPVLPPGARSAGRLLETCVACGLCIDRCPSKVLQPSLGQLGARGFMMPRLDHAVSYCQYDCTVCMDVCPSGALDKLDLAGKHVAKIGDASLIWTLCVVYTKETKCGACAEHCPTGAVRMVAGTTGLPEPVFTSSICIGCGACHHACPVRPDRAISVSGLALQAVAERPSESLFDPGPSASGRGATEGSSAPGDGGDSDTGAFPF
jgi:ferredoxin